MVVFSEYLTRNGKCILNNDSFDKGRGYMHNQALFFRLDEAGNELYT